MGKSYSFDIISQVDLQELDNAINQARKEITTRYDFKGSKAEIRYDKKTNEILMIADDDMKYDALLQVLKGRCVSRGISVKSLLFNDKEQQIDGTIHQKITLHMAIPQDFAKKLTQIIRSLDVKVQPQIQDDIIRVNGKSKDDLQQVITHVKQMEECPVPLQFTNFR